MRAYSMDLRERVLRDSDAGMKAAVVARVTTVVDAELIVGGNENTLGSTLAT